MNIFIKLCFILILIICFNGKKNYEIYIKNQILKSHIIVSLTTTRNKIKLLVVDHLIKSLLNQSILPYKILLSINKTDFDYMSDYLLSLIENNSIELIFINQNLKHFNKYYYIPNKYKKFIITVFDDNIILEKNAIEDLFKSYLIYPAAISARRVYQMTFDKKWNLRPFKFWIKNYQRERKPKFSLFAIHGAGTLFPPNTLNITEDFIYYFKQVINAHDFIIKYFELKENLKTVYVNNSFKYLPLNIHFYEKYNNLLSISPDDIQLAQDFKISYNLSIYNNIFKDKITIFNETKDYFLNKISNNTITNDTLLVSMTSYPARLFGISDVFFSLLNQTADINSYQCFLTLAKEEFVNAEKDLPIEIQKLILNRWVKIIWYHNIYSHKKLMPILQKYPYNDILIVDDDIIRPTYFIELFQNDHRLYPTDIICGVFPYFYDKELQLKRIKGYKQKGGGVINPVPNIIFQTTRPANGFGGVLYPKHSFTDPRFFQESIYMRFSPSSDESWQYAFNIIENKILRQTSIIIDNTVNIVKNSQKIQTSLYKINPTKYPIINQNLIRLFPEFKNNSLKRQKKILVSLTSYKNRLKKINLVLDSIFNNTMKPSKIVLTIYKNDFFF